MGLRREMQVGGDGCWRTRRSGGGEVGGDERGG